GITRGYVKAVRLDCQERAGREPDKVLRVRQPARLVDVVDAPDESSFDVAPGAEVLDVQIADGQHRRGISHLGADGGPLLDPAIERHAQEQEGVFRQAFVLEPQVWPNDRYGAPEPRLVGFRRLEDVHL